MSQLRQIIIGEIQRNISYSTANRCRYKRCIEFLYEKLNYMKAKDRKTDFVVPRLKDLDFTDEKWINELDDKTLVEYYERIVVATYTQR